MIRTCNFPTYLRTPSSCRVTHAIRKGHVWSTATIRSLNSIVEHLNFNMIMFSCLNHANFWENSFLEKNVWMLRFFFGRVYNVCLWIKYIVLHRLSRIRLHFTYNHIGDVMASVLVSIAVDGVFEPRSGQNKDYKIGISEPPVYVSRSCCDRDRMVVGFAMENIHPNLLNRCRSSTNGG